MKNYFSRIRSGCKIWQLCFWWIFRLLMIYAMIKGFTKVPFDITDPLQVGANLLGMFAWEIFQAMPAKNMLRHIPSYLQNFSSVGLFAASFGGKFLNLYYDNRWWDSALHLIGGCAAVFIGYEVVCAMQKRDKKAAPVPIVVLCGFGYAFILSTAWELFEFTFDQIAGMSGIPGDAQHWSYALAEGTQKIHTLFDPIDPTRWPIMDTMGDIVLNTVGGVASYIFLKIFPYRHRGKNDLNKLYAESAVASEDSAKQEATV